MFHSVTCSTVSHVLQFHMSLSVTCAKDLHVLVQVSQAPQCHMFQSVTCPQGSHVSQCHIFQSVTCPQVSHVPKCHMFHSVTCPQVSHVPKCYNPLPPYQVSNVSTSHVCPSATSEIMYNSSPHKHNSVTIIVVCSWSVSF